MHTDSRNPNHISGILDKKIVFKNRLLMEIKGTWCETGIQNLSDKSKLVVCKVVLMAHQHSPGALARVPTHWRGLNHTPAEVFINYLTSPLAPIDSRPQIDKAERQGVSLRDDDWLRQHRLHSWTRVASCSLVESVDGA